jgi:poly-beta-1,6-N-acetyl-D-glucosamine synthase
MKPFSNYVVITPAKNEQDFIEETIKSVVAQSLQPCEWVIVSDGSTDRTDEIVQDYASRHSFLRLVRLENSSIRNFSAKVAAYGAGLQALRSNDYDFIGNLDADVSFRTDYFERLLERFRGRDRLGIGGGLILERIGREFRPQPIYRHSVSGAVQLFRSRCFRDIGGYTPVRCGGIDTVAEVMARMHGWEVETFPDLHVLHHRRVQTGAGNVFTTRFRQGVNHSRMGYHWFFQLLSSASRLGDPPRFIGAALVMAGYSWGSLRYREIKVLPLPVIEFLRTEQLNRIKSIRSELTKRVRPTGTLDWATERGAATLQRVPNNVQRKK